MEAEDSVELSAVLFHDDDDALQLSPDDLLGIRIAEPDEGITHEELKAQPFPPSASIELTPVTSPGERSLQLQADEQADYEATTLEQDSGLDALKTLDGRPLSLQGAIDQEYAKLLADPQMPVHLLSLATIAKATGTNLNVQNPKASLGLTETEAAARLQALGVNALTPPPERSEVVKYLLCYTDPFMILLLIAGILACVAYALEKEKTNLWIGCVLFGVIVLSSTFAYVQEGKAASVMKSFKSMLPQKATVIRDGQVKQVPATELVIGDIVRINTGDKVPADMRVVYTSECKVETSALTGESEPLTCTVFTKDENRKAAHNLLYNSSKCLEGQSYGVVYATGDNSAIGQIAELTGNTGHQDTTLQVEIKKFVRALAIFAFCMGVAFFIVGLARGQPIISSFINGFIVVLIANVPEGLPMTVVTCLTITAKKLGQHKVFVKQLKSVETLGSTTCICSDKTGTLTMNVMSVSNIWTEKWKIDFLNAMRMPAMSAVKKGQAQPAHTLLALETVAGICNMARFYDQMDLTDEDAERLEAHFQLSHLDPSLTFNTAMNMFPGLAQMDPNKTLNTNLKRFNIDRQYDTRMKNIVGDASDTALFKYVHARQNIELIRYHHPVVFDIPFNSRNKYSLAIVRHHKIPNVSASARTLMIKGAPEVILTKCTHWMLSGQPVPIDDNFRQNFQDAYEEFGNNGERVLGFAQLELDEKEYGPKHDNLYSIDKQNFPQNGYVFLGLISLVDPPKASVIPAIATCRAAGIQVVMVTGDHALTASAIARQVGIISPHNKTAAEIRRELVKQGKPDRPELEWDEDIDAIAVTGTELDNMTEERWDYICRRREIVFARTTPQQKLVIVKHFQDLHLSHPGMRPHIVAVTGDGVNDAAALKQAHIGVAMGISGSDVARDAAHVILMDDNFQSIVVGVEYGRTIFDNLTKCIAYTTSHMVPEVLPVLLNLAFGIPLMMGALMILVIDLGTELFPAVSLAYEEPESDIMNRPPRNSETDRLVTKQVVMYVAAGAGLIEAGVCILAFFLVLGYHGISASDLWLADDYFKDDAPMLNGKTASEQMNILAQAQTAYFVMLTGTQALHIWLVKTRVQNFWKQPFNIVMAYGVLIEVALIVLIVFLPPSNDFFGTESFPGQYWAFLALSWFVLFVFMELRKYYVSRPAPRGVAPAVHQANIRRSFAWKWLTW